MYRKFRAEGEDAQAARRHINCRVFDCETAQITDATDYRGREPLHVKCTLCRQENSSAAIGGSANGKNSIFNLWSAAVYLCCVTMC